MPRGCRKGAGTVAAMDLDALESEAQSAIAASGTRADLRDAHVRYLGRKSDLKLALREVRDRESGMALNRVRERIEGAFAEREAELERAELERSLAAGGVDVTLPGDDYPRGQLHPITQIRRAVEDVFLGLGYHVRVRPRGRDDRVQLRQAQVPAVASDPLAAARRSS